MRSRARRISSGGKNAPANGSEAGFELSAANSGHSEARRAMKAISFMPCVDLRLDFIVCFDVGLDCIVEGIIWEIAVDRALRRWVTSTQGAMRVPQQKAVRWRFALKRRWRRGPGAL